MTNRKDRRAKTAVIKKLPDVPNMSGTDQSCGNCGFACPGERWAPIVKAFNAQQIDVQKPGVAPIILPMPEPDHTLCMYETGDKWKRLWAWCSHWKERI